MSSASSTATEGGEVESMMQQPVRSSAPSASTLGGEDEVTPESQSAPDAHSVSHSDHLYSNLLFWVVQICKRTVYQTE